MDREKLLATAPDRKAVKVNGETVYIREISLTERIAVETAAAAKDAPSLAALLVCMAATDADGKPLMTLADAAAVDKLPTRTIGRLARTAMQLNAIGEDAELEARGN